MKTDYKKQAEAFLLATNTKMIIQRAVPQKKPLWISKKENHGINYSVTLLNLKHTYIFDYWGSINDKEKNQKPSSYDVLACFNNSTGEETFEDFCASFGYSDDSIIALKTFKAVKNENINLKKLFTEKELEALTEIQ